MWTAEPLPLQKGVAVTPDSRFVYVGHGAPTDTADSVLTSFALNADGSLGSNVAEATNGTSAGEVVVTPDGRFLYVTSQGSDRLFGYRIGADGSLTAVPSGPFPSLEAMDFVSFYFVSSSHIFP